MVCFTENPPQLSVDEAHKIIEYIETQPMIEGEKWYVISHGWWMRFMELTDNPQGKYILLPPISNELLVEQKNQVYDLKPKLVEGLNFVFVPENSFFILKKTFGVALEERDVIERTVIKGTLMEKRTFIEVYPLEIKVAHFKKKNEVITLKVSQAEDIQHICEKALKKLNITDIQNKHIRYLIKDNEQYIVLPSAISQLSMQSILSSGSVIYIDDENPDLNEQSSSEEVQTTTASTTTTSSTNNSQPTKNLGFCGLQNLGNTCFMNNALQCLSNIPELTSYFLNGNYLEEINTTNKLGTQGQLARAYGALIYDMWSGTSAFVKPNKFKAVISEFAPRFNGYAQQDSQELTSFLLDGLHEDLNRIKVKPYIEEKNNDDLSEEQAAEEAWNIYKKRNNSIIVDLMHGQLKSTLVCPVCSKISIKFDPFCFLSVPVPAKERQTSSIVTLIRSDKWAKFAISHSNRATVGQALSLIKLNLQLPESTKIVLLTTFAPEILKDDVILTPSPYASTSTTKNYYAYIVDERPLVIVENKLISYERNLGIPLVLNLPGDGKTISRKLIMDNILPIIKERFFKTFEEENNENIENLKNHVINEKDELMSSQSQQTPLDIVFYVNKKYVNLPVKTDESVPIPQNPDTEFRITLKWESTEKFRAIEISRLVEREISMLPLIKKTYTLKECVDLFTVEEQLGHNDSWFCPNCKDHQRAFKKLDLWALPKILIIHLKRFQYSRYNRDKIDTEIVVPTKALDLSDKVINPKQKNKKYDLIAMSSHSGGLGSGHYTALALNNNRWLDFNDSCVSVVTNPISDHFSSREAYILFYRRRDDDTN